MNSKTLNILLILAVTILSYQSYSLAQLNTQVDQAMANFSSVKTVNLSQTTETPEMVGGC